MSIILRDIQARLSNLAAHFDVAAAAVHDPLVPKLDPQLWPLVNEHLSRVMDLPESQRRQYLADLHANNSDIANEIAGILRTQDSQGFSDFLSQPLPAHPTADAASQAGIRLGPYVIEHEIGRGGMGSVWLARRADGRFEGHVAVKLLNASLIGRPGEQRFIREGNVLATLRHANIAHLLDAGVADTGQPYLVLEFVQGQRIDQYCDARKLTHRQRIELFLDVLAAVSHAHSNLVVHRDLKPGNILVTDDGRVKLLDFGIAALLAPESPSPTPATVDISSIFTPDYAAPEQMLNRPVTTATDVYALGLVLFVLLVGKNPHTDTGDSPAARIRTIVDNDAPLLSASAGDAPTAKLLRGDLDAIVGKALRKLPRDRYATADALADDLKRFLADEPVMARANLTGYRVRKFVDRHRGAVLGTCAAVLGLIVATGFALYQMTEARGQRAMAQQQARVAIARGAAAYAVAQTPIRLDRALLLGAESVNMHLAPETSMGLLTAIDAGRNLKAFHTEFGDEVQTFVVSPDQSEFVTAEASGRVRRWSLADSRLLAETQTDAGSPLYLGFRGGGRLVIFNGESGGVLLDAKTLKSVSATFKPPDETGMAYVDADDDAGLVATADYLGRTIIVTDPAGHRPPVKFEAASCTGISVLLWAPGKHQLVAGCNNGASFYDALTGALRRGPVGTSTASVDFSPDGKIMLISGRTNEVMLLDATTLQPLMPTIVVPGGRMLTSRFSRDGSLLALGCDNGWIAVWDLISKREIQRFGGLENSIQALDWLADRATYRPEGGLKGDARLVTLSGSTITEWDLTQSYIMAHADRAVDLTPLNLLDQPVDAARGIAYRRSVATWPPQGPATVSVVALSDGAVQRTFKFDALQIASLTVSADGTRMLLAALQYEAATKVPLLRLLVASTRDGAIERHLQLPDAFYDANANVDTVATRDAGEMPGVAARFSPDGTRLFAISNGKAAIWSLGTGALMASIAIDPRTRVISWAPDGKVVALTTFSGVVYLRDAQTLKPISDGIHISTETRTIKDMFPSPKLGGIVVSSEYGAVGILDTRSQKFTGELFQSGGSQLQRSAVSEDGQYLASWSSDGSVRIWDTSTRKAIGPPLRGHPAGRNAELIWFNSDKSLSTYTPGLKIDWNLDIARAARRVCDLVPRSLTEREWKQFVGDVPYAPGCMSKVVARRGTATAQP